MDDDIEVSRRHADLIAIKFFCNDSIVIEEKRRNNAVTNRKKKMIMKLALAATRIRKDVFSPANRMNSSGTIGEKIRGPTKFSELISERMSSADPNLSKPGTARRGPETLKSHRVRMVSTARMTNTGRDSFGQSPRLVGQLSTDRHLGTSSGQIRSGGSHGGSLIQVEEPTRGGLG